jgi:hypothetical protein
LMHSCCILMHSCCILMHSCCILMHSFWKSHKVEDAEVCSHCLYTRNSSEKRPSKDRLRLYLWTNQAPNQWHHTQRIDQSSGGFKAD